MNVEWLNKLNRYKANEVGEKASLLGEICSLNSKFIIPQGFVLKKFLMESFFKENDLEGAITQILDGVNFDNFDDLKNAYKKIRERILNSKFSKKEEEEILSTYKQIGISEEIRKYGKAIDLVKGQRDNQFVAVRPSPLKGLNVYKSFLQVAGKDSLLRAIKECFASLYSPEALFYRKNFEINGSLGIIIQRMVVPEKSAGVFTSNPLGRASEIIVEASWGLGTSLSQGIVSPDQYKIDKNTGQLIEENISLKDWMFSIETPSNEVVKERVPSELRNRSVLTNKELSLVVETALTIENKLNGPYKINFSISRGRIILLGLERIKLQDRVSERETGEKLLLKGFAASPGSCSGVAKVIYDPHEIALLKKDSILVTINTSLDFLPAVRNLKGFITDEGAIGSKMAAVLRELEIPLITGAKNATELLNSVEITMNGNTGDIFENVLEKVHEKIPSTNLITGTSIKTLGSQKISGSDGAVILNDISLGDLRNLALEYESEQIWVKSNFSFNIESPYYNGHPPFENLPKNVKMVSEFSDLEEGERWQGVILRDFASIMQLEDYINKTKFVLIDIAALSKNLGHDLEHPAIINSIKKVSELCKRNTELSVLLEYFTSNLLERLVEIGVDSVVVYPEDFNKVKEVLARKERKFILKKLRNM